MHRCFKYKNLSGSALMICLFYLREDGMQSQCLFLFPYHAGKSSLYSSADLPGHQLNFQVQGAPNQTRKKKNLQKPPVFSTQCCHIPWIRANKKCNMVHQPNSSCERGRVFTVNVKRTNLQFLLKAKAVQQELLQYPITELL